MNEQFYFKEINAIENDIVVKSLSSISPGILHTFSGYDKNLYISHRKTNGKPNYPSIYLISNFISKKVNSLDFRDKIYSAGTYFGFIKNGTFYLSLEGAEYLYNQGFLSEVKHLYVTTKGEKATLYGNNISKNLVSKRPPKLHKGDFLLIFNDHNEMIAIAQSKVEEKDFETLEPRDLVALNLSDKGTYLREKQ
jgi:ribosome biogenesis protein Nip4